MKELFLVSGPSGSGKTTLMRETGLNKIVTMTTRPKRDGEIDGIDYFFVSNEDFERFLNEKKVIEYNRYKNGHYYGLTKEVLETQLQSESAYIIVEANGMLKYKAFYPHATSLFIYSDYESTKKQLFDRGGEQEEIEARLSLHMEEIKDAHLYDILINNEYGKFFEVVEKIKYSTNNKKNA